MNHSVAAIDTVENSILKVWVMRLGRRHQGVLLTAVRGCDTAPKDDTSKAFTRCYRGVVLNAHCGDAAKAQSFMESISAADEAERFNKFRRNLDHYPHHFVMHFIHAIEIVGYKHPDLETRDRWHSYYLRLCNGLHVRTETEGQLDVRLNADEDTFGKQDKV